MKVCFLCGRANNLKYFDEAHFEKTRRMHVFRKQRKHMYHDINFPTTMNDAGYHPECYGKFVILKGKYKEEYEMILQGENVSTIKKLHIRS